jgi:hypothetical protein
MVLRQDLKVICHVLNHHTLLQDLHLSEFSLIKGMFIEVLCILEELHLDESSERLEPELPQ